MQSTTTPTRVNYSDAELRARLRASAQQRLTEAEAELVRLRSLLTKVEAELQDPGLDAAVREGCREQQAHLFAEFDVAQWQAGEARNELQFYS
ncbi:MAG: hypothetical protein J0M00_03445 [Burkholderiales bacterium]|nr:hypothetical protein [Burkholderiales bacterium]